MRTRTPSAVNAFRSLAYEDVLRTGTPRQARQHPSRLILCWCLTSHQTNRGPTRSRQAVARLRRRSHPPAASQLAHVGAVRYRPCTHALYTLHRLAIHLPAAVRAEPDWRQTLGMVSMQCNTVRGNGLPRKQCEGSRTVGRAGFPYCRDLRRWRALRHRRVHRADDFLDIEAHLRQQCIHCCGNSASRPTGGCKIGRAHV